MSDRARLTLYAAIATALGMLSLTPLLRPAGWIIPAGGLILVIALVGAGLRRLSAPHLLTVLVQLVVAGYLLLFGSVRTSFIGVVVPGPNTLSALNDLLVSAGNDISQYTIPAPATPGLRFVMISSVALVAILVDGLAVGFRRAPLAGLPLLALYSVGTGLAGPQGGAGWLWFLAAGAGYLMLLFAEGRDRLSRWGRVFRGAGTGDGPSGVPTGGHRIGLVALAVAMVLPALAPNWDLSLVNNGFGNDGTGSGGGNINALSPVVALTDGLRGSDNQELLSYRGDPSVLRSTYLRITALDEFDGQEWKPGKQDIVALPSVLPAPAGLAGDVPATPFVTTIAMSPSLSTNWLPAPYPMERVRVPGNWRYEPEVGALVGGQSLQPTGLDYTVTSLAVDPTPEQLRDAPPAPKSITDSYLDVPGNLPGVVKATALQVTAGKETAYDKAVALQDWFTTTGGFSYSTHVDQGTGPDAIAKFLQDRTGFCVHFSATMAAMARTLGIPARVAVGFAPGHPNGDGSFTVGTQDYHAWPELYFSGVGWVRFEPTPSRGVAPDYSRPQGAAATPTGPATASATPDQPTSAPNGENCPAEARKQGSCGHVQPTATASAAALPVAAAPTGRGLPAGLIGGLAGGALVLLLLLSPMLWRSRLRRRRLGSGRRRPGGPGGALTEAQVLAAWQELIDSAWDLGIPPDEAHSPRLTGERISTAAGLDGPARAAVGRVALATERVLYARTPEPAAPLGPDVRLARAGLRSSAGLLRRVRAVLLPPSAAQLGRRLADRVLAARLRTRAALARAGARLRRPERADRRG
ncbi:transglutaminaseTgpA domain-containing protein [Kitasatospora sp. LaBMicrA B282]|uniref:transglutaminase family protein n=1 Tax=Kitasatospora sp. LaBMicrA B282 TaxID=3420949 RepID=UPI003D0DD152